MTLSGNINWTSIPSSLVTIVLQSNLISGLLPSEFPPSLIDIELEYNLINGTIPLVMSNLITTLYLNENPITGTLPTSLPTSLRKLYVQNSLLTGILPYSLPIGLTDLMAFGTKMNGDVPILPKSLQYLKLGYPGYFGTQFTGTVEIYQPLELYITSNLITDVIVHDITYLRNLCDLSNNPLIGSFQLNALAPECNITGIYNPNGISKLTLSKMVYSINQRTQVVSSVSIYTTFLNIGNPSISSPNIQQTTNSRSTVSSSIATFSPDFASATIGQWLSSGFGITMVVVISFCLLVCAVSSIRKFLKTIGFDKIKNHDLTFKLNHK